MCLSVVLTKTALSYFEDLMSRDVSSMSLCCVSNDFSLVRRTRILDHLDGQCLRNRWIIVDFIRCDAMDSS